MLAAVTAVLSNLVSNVPAVLVLKPFVARLADPAAGLAHRRHGRDARRQLHPRRLGRQSHRRAARRAAGVTIGFWTYFKIGAPVTVVTILFGVWWL